jgi:hypothetical protein
MIEAPDRLNWPGLELRRQVYEAYHNWPRLLQIQLLALLIFFAGNLGVRLVGITNWFRGLRSAAILDQLLFWLPLIAFLPPLFFLQKGTAWNTIQFVYYFIFIFSFWGAIAWKGFLLRFKRRSIRLVWIVILLAVALPSTLKTMSWFTGQVPTTLLAKEEKEALQVINQDKEKEKIVLTYPYQERVNLTRQVPVPMSDYNSMYVSFFSGKRVYLEDTNTANISGYPWQERLRQEKIFFETKDSGWAKAFLKENRIGWVYLVGGQRLPLAPAELGLKQIWSEAEVRIYRLDDTMSKDD